jgi:aspartyl/asparaginyl-tRNA synthetase
MDPRVQSFYTMPDPDDPKLPNSFDISVRGDEILYDGQRLHYAEELQKRLKEAGVDAEGMQDYIK